MTHWPQVLVLARPAFSICLGSVASGRQASAIPALGAITDAVALALILYAGGFFAVWGWAP